MSDLFFQLDTIENINITWVSLPSEDTFICNTGLPLQLYNPCQGMLSAIACLRQNQDNLELILSLITCCSTSVHKIDPQTRLHQG